MKNQAELEKRLKRLEQRVEQVWQRYEKNNAEFLYRKAQELEGKVELLKWCLNK